MQEMKIINMNIVKQNMLMTSELIKVIKELEKNNIQAISFKGPVLSEIGYGNITVRQYMDLDILVNQKDLENASIYFLNNDYQEVYDFEEYQKENLKNTGHDRSFINRTTGVKIELHWTLSSSEFFIDLEKLNYHDNCKTLSLKNHDLRTLSNEIHFIYLCIHGNKHMWERIEWLLDLVLFIKKEKLDLVKILILSQDIDADRIVLSSLMICKHFFSINLPAELDKNIDKKLQDITNKYTAKLCNDYKKQKDNIHNKQISYIQWYMLKTYSNRLKYIKSLFLPTEKDYMQMNIKKEFHFIYFFLRPLNIIFRIIKKKF